MFGGCFVFLLFYFMQIYIFNFYRQLKFSQKLRKMRWKNEVSLTDKFYGLDGVYHQYVFKYERKKKIPATVQELLNKIKTGSWKIKIATSEHP